MDEVLQTALREWGNFYLLSGTAAATLIGLQFVAYSIAISEIKGSKTYQEETQAYVTPTIYHFGFALAISLFTVVPGLSELILAILLALLGLVGAIGLRPARIVVTHLKRLPLNVADLFWYVVAPLLSYVLLLITGVLLALDFSWSLYILAIVVALFLATGLRNAWNFVLWISRQRGSSE